MNTASGGGGILNLMIGKVYLSGSLVAGNRALYSDGGGILNYSDTVHSGVVTLVGSAVVDNTPANCVGTTC